MKPNPTYAEFWRDYMRAHQHPANRALHCIGIVLAVAGLATAAIRGPAWLAVPSIALGYGLSWWSCPGFVDGYGFGRAGGRLLLS